MMTKRNVMISITTSRQMIAEGLFDGQGDADDFEDWDEGESSGPEEMLVEGKLVTSEQRVELLYEESELSGMLGSVTTIGFARNAPELISMNRTGTVLTSLVFEAGKRHFSVYDTPLSSFQVCVRTLRVENRLLSEGKLEIEYLIEIHGAQAERCEMSIAVREAKNLFD
ncbi:MAG: DUF1934 domain-containing protein [Clostridia bacterium]|nr:DUF1934 domain-containing protein [Clostridia bacterium]